MDPSQLESQVLLFLVKFKGSICRRPSLIMDSKNYIHLYFKLHLLSRIHKIPNIFSKIKKVWYFFYRIENDTVFIISNICKKNKDIYLA